MRCPRCDAEHEGQPNFCTRCGYALAAGAASLSPGASAPASPGTSGPAPGPAETRFVACPACGATNAASRHACGRCGDALDGDETSGARSEPAMEDVGDEEAPNGSPVVFVAAVSLAAVAIVGVILTVLSASGVGPFARPAAEPEELAVAVSSVRASSVRPPAGGVASDAEHLVDGDVGTAWRESASGDGVGEWVELQLEGTPSVSRLLVWNGDQRDGAFAAGARPAEVRIDAGDRTFTADLLDIDGPQAIDLPEVVDASVIRLTIAAVEPGEGGVAISEIEVRGPPPEAGDTDA